MLFLFPKVPELFRVSMRQGNPPPSFALTSCENDEKATKIVGDCSQAVSVNKYEVNLLLFSLLPGKCYSNNALLCLRIDNSDYSPPEPRCFR